MILSILFISLVVLNITFLVIIAYNFFTAPIIKNDEIKSEKLLAVSILIPARNEEKNIAACIDSILDQSYQNYELIILDDDSSDNTYQIVEKYADKDESIKLVKGKPLPIGWLGKNWACFQLARLATNDLFLFIDADVRLKRYAISNALKSFSDKKVNMLSVFPSQIIDKIGAQLVIPLMNWILLTFLPLIKVYTSPKSSFVAANGQFILIDRTTYESTGGHSAVRDQVVEDMELARRLKKRGLKMLTALGSDSIYCRMYGSFSESVKGFSKNFFKGFNMNPVLFLTMIIFFEFVFLAPFVLMILNINFIVVVISILIGRVLIALMSKQKLIINIIFHFLQMAVLLIVGIKSVYGALLGTHEWKGRKI